MSTACSWWQLNTAAPHARREKHQRLKMVIMPTTRTRFFSPPSLTHSPWGDVAALLHEGSQGEPERVEDAELVGRLVGGAQLSGALLWLLCVPLVWAEATHLQRGGKGGSGWSHCYSTAVLSPGWQRPSCHPCSGLTRKNV